MEKRKGRFTMVVTREYEIDLADYQNIGSKEHPQTPCQTIDEAAKFDVEFIKQDPFSFLDNENTELEVKFEILPE